MIVCKFRVEKITRKYPVNVTACTLLIGGCHLGHLYGFIANE